MSDYYSEPVAPNRARNTMTRWEYQSRRTEFALRGQDLGQAKLCDLDVISIRSAHRQRLALIKHIAENLSNEALAKKFGVHRTSIEKIVTRRSWSHLP